jgi:predicted transcriptional regulator
MESGVDSLREGIAMTPKEKINAFVERMCDDVTMEQVLYDLELFVGIETGLAQLDRGEFIEHDDLFDELLKPDEKKKGNVVRAGGKGSLGNKKPHRSRLTKNGSSVRKSVKEIGK